MSIEREWLRRISAGILALSLALPSFAVDRNQHGLYAECTSGDCQNGQGTILRADLKKAYTGRWSNGRFVDGMYDVQYGGVPGTFPMRYGADGLPKEGTMAFSNGDKFDTFTGTFGPPPETFVTEGNQLLYMFRKQGSVLRKGRYLDRLGYIYEGEFEYIPLVRKVKSQFGETTLARGVYVFLGARIDEALQEVENGVFVSHEVGPDMTTQFFPASGSYLAKLQEELMAARSDIQREKADAARASRETWNTFLGVLAGVAVVVIGSKAASSSGGSSSIGGLKDVLRGNESPGTAASRMQSSSGAAPAAKQGAVMALSDYKRIREGGSTISQIAPPGPPVITYPTRCPPGSSPSRSPATSPGAGYCVADAASSTFAAQGSGGVSQSGGGASSSSGSSPSSSSAADRKPSETGDKTKSFCVSPYVNQNGICVLSGTSSGAGKTAEADRDIYEPKLDRGGRVWMEGGGGGVRKPVSTRAEACQQAERDREETIAINARDKRDRGVERRSECICNYSARIKLWYCSTYFLPVGHSASGNTR